MPVTHGVTGSSPVRTANEFQRNLGLVFIMYKLAGGVERRLTGKVWAHLQSLGDGAKCIPEPLF